MFPKSKLPDAQHALSRTPQSVLMRFLLQVKLADSSSGFLDFVVDELCALIEMIGLEPASVFDM